MTTPFVSEVLWRSSFLSLLDSHASKCILFVPFHWMKLVSQGVGDHPAIRVTPYSEPQCPRVTRRIELSFSLLPAKASLGNEATTTTTTTTTHELSYPNPSGSSFISFVLSRSTAIAALPTSHGRNQTPSA